MPTAKSTPTLAEKCDAVIQQDPQDIVKEITGLSKEEAGKAVVELYERGQSSLFALGGVLSRIRLEKWFDNHKNFAELVEKKYGIHRRKADYLATIYDTLVDVDVPKETFTSLPWSKLREIARVLTKENAEYWVDRASEVTHAQLVKEVKAAFKNKDKADLTLMKFAPHVEQKEVIDEALSKAKIDAKVLDDADALEHICNEYLWIEAPSLEMKLKQLDDQGKKDVLRKLALDLGLESACNLINDVFPGANFELIIPEDVDVEIDALQAVGASEAA